MTTTPPDTQRARHPVLKILGGIALALLLLILFCFSEGWSADPTYGFTDVPLTEWNFELQKPYDVPLEEHYSYENGVRKLWVYADDKPHDPNSLTQPRTEVRIRVLSLSLPLPIHHA